MAEALTGWFPVVTLVVGYCLKAFLDWLQDKRTIRREREARESERAQRLAERTTEFQRQTLLDLQEALLDLARATGAAHHHDTMVHRSTGQWGRQLLGKELDEQHRLTNRRTTILVVRVLDDSVRALVDKCKSQANQVVLSSTKEQSDAALGDMADSFDRANQRIGELLRKIDDPNSH